MGVADNNRADDRIFQDHPDYEVIRELGQGGMGTVYLVNNRLMGRREVLKVVSGRLIDRRGVRDRFLGEIRNAAKLHHPNIVTAYSAVRLGETIGFAMEYVDGSDLANLVKQRGSLPVTTACSFAYQAALGLQHAHEHGMVHRDIKPSNLIVSRKERPLVVKVLDFGLAKVSRESPVEGGLTHQGQMLGTPEFIAPEQALSARTADIRADIYSLGCTLYYLLAGAPPFQGESLYEILQAHHSMDAMPLNLTRADVPLGLAALVAKMMAKEPDKRFQTPREVADALLPFFKSGNPVVDRVSAPSVAQGAPAVSASVPVQPASPAPARAFAGRAETVWESLVDTGEGPSAASNPSLLGATPARGSSMFGSLFILASGLGLGGLGAVYWVNRDRPVESKPETNIRATVTKTEAPPPTPVPPAAKPPVRDEVPGATGGQGAIAKLTKAPEVKLSSPDESLSQKSGSRDESPAPALVQPAATPPKTVAVAPARTPAAAVVPKIPTPEEYLESRGLTREGKCYVVRAEKQALEEFRAVVARSREMSDSWDLYTAMVERVNLVWALEAEQIETNNLIDQKQFERNNLPNNTLLETRQARANLDQLLVEAKAYAGQIKGKLALAKQQAPSVGQVNVAWDQFTKFKDAFLESCEVVEPTVVRTLGEYSTLKSDTDVRNAIDAIAARAKLAGTLKLGPTRDFERLVNDKNKFKRFVSTEANVPRRSVKPKKPVKK